MNFRDVGLQLMLRYRQNLADVTDYNMKWGRIGGDEPTG